MIIHYIHLCNICYYKEKHYLLSAQALNTQILEGKVANKHAPAVNLNSNFTIIYNGQL